MRYSLLSVLSIFVLLGSPLCAAEKTETTRPNILWLSCEDINPHLACYGDKYAITPTLDKFASEGVRYTNVHSTAGVCSATRTCIITGMYGSTLGSHHHRSLITLPNEIKCFPEFLRKAGYYCTNNAKTDYNFGLPKEAWDACNNKAHWKNRPKGKPFFAVFNFGTTHESRIRFDAERHARLTKRLTPEQRQDPDRITPPPFHPNAPLTRHDWAMYYENITALDYQIAEMLQELREAGLEEDTIVFFWGDHGAGLPRMKRCIYSSGTHSPLLVRIPKKFRVDGQGKPNSVDDQLVSFIDLAPTVLNLAGVPLPKQFQGHAFLGKNLTPPRQYLYGARDRMDERYDTYRMVRDHDYLYIRNYEPYKSYDQFTAYGELMPTMQEMRRLHNEGKLSDEVEIFFHKTKPIEELYDVKADPDQMKNLAALPKYQKVLKRMRAEHRRWQNETRDLGLIPEAEMIRRAEKLGSQYAILQQPGAKDLMRRVYATIDAGEQGKIGPLLAAMKDPDPVVRYWAATWLGYLGNEKLGPHAKKTLARLESALGDDSPTVRTAAARAVYLLDGPQKALPVLVKELEGDQYWDRVAAVDVLDMMGEDARPALAVLKKASQEDEKESRYVVLLAAHAVEQLEKF